MKLLIKVILFLSLTSAVVISASYYVATNDLIVLDKQVRESLPGHFIEIEDGVLSYTRDGNIEDPIVILVHGFTSSKFVWDQSVPVLVAAGYQVIRFDHFGRGFSDRPAGPYDAAFYRRELTGLLDGLNIKEPVTLVGYSMGGANTVDFTANNMDRINGVALIAPAVAMEKTALVSLLKMPVLPSIFFRSFMTPIAEYTISKAVKEDLAPQTLLDQYQAQSIYTGYADALLSTITQEDVWDMRSQLKHIGNSDLSVSVLWGREDKVVRYEGLQKMQASIPQLHVQTEDKGKHTITFTQPDVTNAFLLSALSRIHTTNATADIQ